MGFCIAACQAWIDRKIMSGLPMKAVHRDIPRFKRHKTPIPVKMTGMGVLIFPV
jgi:hypothetical protein